MTFSIIVLVFSLLMGSIESFFVDTPTNPTNISLSSQSTVSSSLPEYENQGLIGPEGGRIVINNDQGEQIARVTINTGFLTRQVLVTTEVADNHEEETYLLDRLKFTEDDTVVPIGPQVTVTFPYDAIDVQSKAYFGVFIHPYEGMYDESRRNVYATNLIWDGGSELKLGQIYSLRESTLATGSAYRLDNPPELHRFITRPFTVIESQRE
ncbi:MAG: hypothetical protein AAF267_15710 [Deinococcota bacterium]